MRNYTKGVSALGRLRTAALNYKPKSSLCLRRFVVRYLVTILRKATQLLTPPPTHAPKEDLMVMALPWTGT